MLKIGPGVELRRGCIIEMDYGSTLLIGANTVFSYGVVVQCTAQIEIGRDCLLAPGVSVVDSRHRYENLDSESGGMRPLELRPVSIGDGVWISAKATINADVGDGAVVGANSAVIRPVPPRVLAGGVPARTIRELN